MSPCSRGAISRTLRLDVRLASKTCPRQLANTFYPCVRLPPSVAKPFTRAGQQTRNPLRAFSTTRSHPSQAPVEELTDVLPACCPGCGAFSQTIEPNEPGYYSESRKQIRKLLATKRDTIAAQYKETQNASVENLISNALKDFAKPQTEPTEDSPVPRPIQEGALLDEASEDPVDAAVRASHVCNRCHDLIHHNKAVSAPKPSLLSIREFLKESPYKHNRVYHVLDAADFPMSLIPRINQELSLQDLRSRNRRASNEKYERGRKLPTLNFVITRSDLLAPTKEQVDSKMEYMRTVLRRALGRAGKDVRLGIVHMISAHRGWWNKQVKEEIREHGGGIWIVGKANVGKSSFIQACFPKSSGSAQHLAEWDQRQREETEVRTQRVGAPLDPKSLLPPAPQEESFPMLPVVSSMPGTTVSPIRIPFGRGQGEVIDLPGLDRGQLEDCVRDEHKRDLIMTKRIKPDRCAIKPGQSLLLGGGLVRITPVNPEDTVLAACFVPIESHVTKTEKAIEMQTEERPYSKTVLMKEGTGSSIASAGKFDLEWDVTASNLPSSIAKAVKDKGIPVPRLPYRVMSADILIEGCGWVEVSVQVRAKRSSEADSTHPQVEVFTPNGKHIGSRPPLEAWKYIEEKRKKDKRKTTRLRHRYS